MKKQDKLPLESEFWETCGGRVVPEDFEPPADPDAPEETPRKINLSGFLAGVMTALALGALVYFAVCVAVRVVH